jgi:L-malate glycosyltransferase
MLPSFSSGDAISNEVVTIKRFLESEGYTSKVYAQHIHDAKSDIIPYKRYKRYAVDKSTTIFHMSIGSDMSTFLMRLPGTKMMIYHNITPPEYFIGINDELTRLCWAGRHELGMLSPHLNLALGDSEYNRKDLEENQYAKTGTLPILLDMNMYEGEPDKNTLKRYSGEYTNIIFVGRISPNKRQEDVIRSFYYYNKYINKKSRLFLVGSYTGTERYYCMLNDLVRKLGLDNVIITGKVELNELLAYYYISDVFLCMSEHEGFCVPLLESMHFKIPIIAYNATAVPYTLGGSGILVNRKDYECIGELINLVVEDESFKKRIVKKQTERLSDFTMQKTEIKLKKYLGELLG